MLHESSCDRLENQRTEVQRESVSFEFPDCAPGFVEHKSTHPPLVDESSQYLPVEWINLPSLAIPDGAHHAESDVLYFLLPSREDAEKAFLGFHVIDKSMQIVGKTTQSYFNGRDFSKIEVLSQMYQNLVDVLEEDLTNGQSPIIDTSARRERLYLTCFLWFRQRFDTSRSYVFGPGWSARHWEAGTKVEESFTTWIHGATSTIGQAAGQLQGQWWFQTRGKMLKLMTWSIMP
ncbi:unnamed protein product, partial [Mesorhabditis belari]|uniref:AVL9/DENND6 domain-containing protein n=1 Tax=Mesorhabditis belari TaxID=2138241 RepID=A0AAF3F022_9BILA